MLSKFFVLLTITIFLLAAQNSRAAITVENFSSTANFAVGGVRPDAVTFSHTVSGAGRVLYIGVSTTRTEVVAPTTCAPLSTPIVTAISYNGKTTADFDRLTTPVTNLPTVFAPDNCSAVEILRLVNPPAGTANVSVTAAISGDYLVIGAVSLLGVDQTTSASGALLSASGTNNAPTITVPTAAGNTVLDTVAAEFNAGRTIPDAAQTELWRGMFSGLVDTGGGSSKTATAASTTTSWTLDSPGNWVLGATVLKPSGTTASPAAIGGRVARGDGDAPIAGARVTLIDFSTGETRVTTTDENGRYFFENLELSKIYQVKVTHERFSFRADEQTFNLFQSLENINFNGVIGRRRGVH